MMFDKLDKIGKSLVQHGKSNNRIYLLKLDADDVPSIIPELDSLAKKNGYTKIFTKIQADVLPEFILNGYTVEAYVPRFYNGKTDCIMASKFLDDKRRVLSAELMESFAGLFNRNGKGSKKELPPRFKINMLGESDAEAAAKIFSAVFETYPFPVHEPAYLRQTMRDNLARYYGVWEDNKLIGLSTAETDFEKENAEMTDFAVLPEYRGNGLASHLLSYMEKEMKKEGIKTAYTIARLAEPGMNLTFMKGGYNFSGTLINNTNIGGNIESMNIFYKLL
ncbi:MAG: putative beta-lysine N-acetyltransferase [Bacteroidota bacterium]